MCSSGRGWKNTEYRIRYAKFLGKWMRCQRAAHHRRTRRRAMESLKPQKSLVEQVYDRLLDAICEGGLTAGTRITQDELAAQLQVSRQPVMSAVGLLRQQGFLVEHGRRGLQVAPVDRAHFDAIYEFRSVVEPWAASLAAQHATPELL